MEPQVGQLISNKYRLVRLIGDGGMGSVFEARHELLGTTVALKFLHGALARRKGLVERFLQEAQVSARIKSNHVVTVSDVDRTPEGLAYMVMEFVDGDTLQTLYEKLYQDGERLTYADAFRYMLQMCEGVRAAHKLGIVHRDLKPDNVMLTADGDGSTKVMILDFGIAKLKASGEVDRGLTRPGVVMGTPEYMAPEQAFSADKVDKRADIFSLGVMFFEMLAGRRPVGGDNAHAIAAQYLEGTVANLRELAPSIDATLSEAVHRAMSAKPAERFESVFDFRNAILPFAPESASAGLLTQTPAPVSPGRASGNDIVDEQTAATDPTVESDGPVVSDELPSSVEVRMDSAFEADSGEIHSGETTKAARREAEEVRGETAMAGSETPTGTSAMPATDSLDDTAESFDATETDSQDPYRAGTEPMPEGALAAQGLKREATENMPAIADMRPHGGSKTQAGDPGFTPPVFSAGAGPAAPSAFTPVARPGGASRRKKGPSFVSILLIAAALSSMVVGGLYLAHEHSLLEDNRDDPPKISLPDKPKKKSKKKGDTTAASQPDPTPAPIPIPDPVPEPAAKPTPTPQPPRPRPQPSTQPPTRPSAPPPFVVPSVIPVPSILPFPGLPGGTLQRPSPTPKPAPAPAPTTTGRPTLQPKPKTQPTARPNPRPRRPVVVRQPKPQPAPAPRPRRRRRFPRLQ